MSQYDFQNKKQNEYGSDLFQEYLNEQENKESQDGIRVSDQVEEDLRRYELFEKHMPKKNRSGDRRKTAVIGLGIVAVAASVAIVAGTVISRMSYSEPEYYEEPYAYDIEEQDGYAYLSENIANPEFVMDQQYYAFPFQVSDLLNNGWEIRTSGFSGSIGEVGSEPAVIRMVSPWGDQNVELTVVSPNGETVPVEEATAVGLYISGWGVDFNLPGYVGIGEGSYYLEDVFARSDVEWVKTGKNGASYYTVSADTDSGTYSIDFEMQDDMVESITLQMQNGQTEAAE